MNPYSKDDLELMTAAYLTCAEFADKPEGSDSTEFSIDTQREAREDCAAFMRLGARWLHGDAVTAENVGHDFWLTRQGHGTGFWDRDYAPKHTLFALTTLADKFGQANVFDDDCELIIDAGVFANE